MAFIQVRNQLAYPGGAPGINPRHVAFSGGNITSLKFSGVAIGGQGSFQRIDRASAATVFGSPSGSIVGGAGPCFTNASTTSGAFFTVGSAKAPLGPGITLAAIFSSSAIQSTVNAYILAGDDQGNQGIGAAISQPTFSPVFWSGASGAVSLTAPLQNISLNSMAMYIVSISAAGKYSALLCSLSKGAWFTTTSGACTAPTEPAGADHVGIANYPNNGSGNQGFNGKIAAAAVLRTFLTVPQLIQWAQAPLDFWYPPIFNNLLPIGRGGKAPIDLAGNLGGVSSYG